MEVLAYDVVWMLVGQITLEATGEAVSDVQEMSPSLQVKLEKVG
jgi:hypothetical protein